MSTDCDVGTKNIRQLSYSSVSSYTECGKRWELSRLHGLDNSTYYATLMGTAVHYITEQFDLLGVGHTGAVEEESTPEAFDLVFSRLVAQEQEAGADIKASGRVLKSVGKGGGPEKKNFDWCLTYGPKIVQSWIDWRTTHSFSVWVNPLSGEPGVEVKCEGVLGGVPVVGYVDRVLVDAKGQLAVVDLKAGNVPSSTGQLKTYVELLRQQGFDVSRAGFWSGMDGDVKEWATFTPASKFLLGEWFGDARRGIEAGVFPANPGSNFCSSCSVREYCYAADGSRVGELAVSPRVLIGVAAGGGADAKGGERG